MAEEIPVYVISGFMDSGKTTLVNETLFEQEFGKDTKTLLIACEDGEVEYDEDKLKTIQTSLVMIENKEDFTEEKLQSLQDTYHPEQVFIEYNGTWEMSILLETKLPEGWVIVQSLATVDATTYEMYLGNMRTMILEQLFAADVVIFNRCDENTPRGKFRRSVKAQNRKAQMVYERKDGTIDDSPEELPYDLSQDFLDITDADYGIWYLDAMDHPKAYDRKKVRFLALVYHPEKLRGKGMFVPGRFAMTCCAEDIQFIGFKCKYPKADEIPHKSWILITAEVRIEWAKEYRGKGPVLYPIKIEKTTPPPDELVYFS
jgi:putative membrane protein